MTQDKNRYIMPKIVITMLCSSILFSACAQEIKTYNGGSVFQCGFARIVNMDTLSNGDVKETSFFIDATGKKVFDDILDKDWAVDDAMQDTVGEKDTTLTKEQNGDKHVLAPVYDANYTDSFTAWLVEKGHKQSILTPKGLLLPFKFKNIQKTNKDYVAVREKREWGIYDLRKGKLVIPMEYQSLDFCAKCQGNTPFIFARKDNHWGIINFQNEI